LLKKEPFADEEAQELLWKTSEAVTGVKFDVKERGQACLA